MSRTKFDDEALAFAAEVYEVELTPETEPHLRRSSAFAWRRFDLALRALGRDLLRSSLHLTR